MTELSVKTNSRCCIINITREVSRVITDSVVISGIAVITVPHTTAGITINENADPDVKTDILMKLDKLVDRDADFKHYEGNSDAHIKAIMTGFSITLIVEGGKPVLGKWQGIYFCEFDGPRTRKFNIEIIGK